MCAVTDTHTQSQELTKEEMSDSSSSHYEFPPLFTPPLSHTHSPTKDE